MPPPQANLGLIGSRAGHGDGSRAGHGDGSRAESPTR